MSQVESKRHCLWEGLWKAYPLRAVLSNQVVIVYISGSLLQSWGEWTRGCLLQDLWAGECLSCSNGMLPLCCHAEELWPQSLLDEVCSTLVVPFALPVWLILCNVLQPRSHGTLAIFMFCFAVVLQPALLEQATSTTPAMVMACATTN
jgi:hypothetical protein